MSKLKWSLLFILVFGLVFPTGCNLGTPVCANDNLKMVVLGAPQDGTITNNLTPVLSWSYPDSTCHPTSYRIFLASVANHSEDWSGVADGFSTTWGPATPLKPGLQYQWHVTPVNGSFYGNSGHGKIFYTGPMCSTASLKAPILDIPFDGAVEDVHPNLLWHYPDACLPQNYRVDLSDDPTFSGTDMGGETGSPSMIWGPPASALTDCTTYFWRVHPENDNIAGPFSEINFFYVNHEQLCAPPAPATVRGVLWYDQCPAPLLSNPIPNPVPAECLLDQYGVDANGMHEPGEPFMTNVTLKIGPDDCSQQSTTSTVTDANGAYEFSGLKPGKYCIHIQANSQLDPNGTGHWTLVQNGHEGNTYRHILVTAGETLTGQNFAWYQYTGGVTPTPTVVSGLSFTPGLNANCHTGPGLIYDVLDVALKGESYPIDGRNQAGDWVRLMLDENKGCWVMAKTGVASGDITGVRVLATPPTPTPGFNCADYINQASCESHLACQWKPKPNSTVAVYICTRK
jgi:hypothetical protein